MLEALLSLITRAVVALESIAAAGPANVSVSGVTTAPAGETPAKRTRKSTPEQPAAPVASNDEDFLGGEPEAKEPEVKYERADVKKALQEYGAKHGMPKAQELFKNASGVTSLSDLPVEKFAAVINATKK